MAGNFLIQADYIFRILGAIICGLILGYERESHMKAAGIRTHTIVALASSLMMIISKYGFYDILALHNIGLDPSRIAAGVVTAIGFLGAGIIFTKKLNVSGLTTSAGIWATVGIGMAFGSGMYFLGIICTLLLLLLQCLLHLNVKWLKSPCMQQVTLRLCDTDNVPDIIHGAFPNAKIRIINMKAVRISTDIIEVKLFLSMPSYYTVENITDLLRKNPQVKSIEL